MARQALGAKKHRLCEAVTGKSYTRCLVRGGGTHFLALCWYAERNADRVNYRTGEWYPEVRDGKFVEPDGTPTPLLSALGSP